MQIIERAARALCAFDGHAENIRFEGAAMWRSYLPEARAVFEAVPGAAPVGADATTWRAMIDAALIESDGDEAKGS